MADPSGPRRSFLDAVVELGKYAIDRERGTPEGRLNSLTLVLATLLLLSSPFWAANIGAEWGEGRGSVDASVGDNIGGVAWIIGGGLVCVTIVAGLNYLRGRSGGRSERDGGDSNR